MKTKIILLLIVLSLLACSRIDKDSKSFLLYRGDNTKIGLAEKNGGVMLKVVYQF